MKLASARWKELQTSLEGLARTQLPRLERAMVEQRTWTLPDFRSYFVEHPVMQHLTRRLL